MILRHKENFYFTLFPWKNNDFSIKLNPFFLYFYMVSSMMSTLPLNISPPIQRSPLVKKHHLPPPSLLNFFWNRSPYSLIYWHDLQNHSKHVFLALTWWYYTWKHSQTYYNKVYHIHKSLYTTYIRVNPVKHHVLGHFGMFEHVHVQLKKLFRPKS